jgi:hypothetical protein
VADGSHSHVSWDCPQLFVTVYVHVWPTEGHWLDSAGAWAGHAGGGGQSRGAHDHPPFTQEQESPPHPSIVVYAHCSVVLHAVPGAGSLGGHSQATSLPTQAHAPSPQLHWKLAPCSQ